MNILCIVGATATGKSALAVTLAKERNGEIVNADSRQLYRGFEIGTGVPMGAECGGIAHHLYAFLSPDDSFSVSEWRKLALEKMQEVESRCRLPILVGGTGFYVHAILENLQFPEVPPNIKLRTRFAGMPLEDLVRELVVLDPHAEVDVDLKNPRRVQRALEVCLSTGKPFTSQKAMGPKLVEAEVMHLTLPRNELRKKIADRIEGMLAVGWLDEVRRIKASGVDPQSPAMQAIGYRELWEVLDGLMSFEEAKKIIIQKTQQYAKKQETWFTRQFPL